jgi:sugar phosphate isomerase/epimerase
MAAAAEVFGCNTYAYMQALSADQCVSRLADRGFIAFEVMVYPGHLWTKDVTGLRNLRTLIQARGLHLVSLNMPNIDINIAAASQEMRAYSLAMLAGVVEMAGELGAGGIVIGPGKANPLFPADRALLTAHFFAALDRLSPLAEKAGTALWVENMPFAFLPDAANLMETLDRYGRNDIGVVYDVANAHFIREDIGQGLTLCRHRLKLVHLSDTGQQVYRHDPVGCGSVPFSGIPAQLRSVGYWARPMLEIIAQNADDEIPESAERLCALGFASMTSSLHAATPQDNDTAAPSHERQ